jgi:superfamily II DNA or RNA helicase
MLENGANKILMIVPSIHLVKQGVEDFKQYKEFFQTETVWAQGESCSCANLTIGTYQSLVQKADKKSKKYNPKFFNGYDVVCVDEAHHLVAKSINTILGQDFMKFVKLRFGFTGTLPQEHSIEAFSCHALMGPKIQNVTTMELVNRGFLAKPIINQIRIEYEDNEDLLNDYIKCGEYLNSSYKEEDGKRILLPKEERDFTIQHVKELPFVLKQLKDQYTKEEYRDYLIDLCKAKGSNLLMLEQMIVHRSQRRLEVMDQIILNNPGNCIVFAHHTEYLKILKKHFEMTFPDRCEHVVLRDRLPGGLAFEDGALATRESAQPPPLFEKEMNHFSLTSKAYLGAEVHFFGSAEQGTSVVLYPVRATTMGSFAIPAVVVEDMYHIDCVGGADPAEILTVE